MIASTVSMRPTRGTARCTRSLGAPEPEGHQGDQGESGGQQVAQADEGPEQIRYCQVSSPRREDRPADDPEGVDPEQRHQGGLANRRVRRGTTYQAAMSPDVTRLRLNWMLKRATGAIGVPVVLGAMALPQRPRHVASLLEEHRIEGGRAPQRRRVAEESVGKDDTAESDEGRPSDALGQPNCPPPRRRCSGPRAMGIRVATIA